MTMRVDNELQVPILSKETDDKPTVNSANIQVPIVSGSVEYEGDSVSFSNKTQKIEVQNLDYSNFGGKLAANKAASIASAYLNGVNEALKNLHKNYPEANIILDKFPDPKEFSKKKFGKEGAYNQWEKAVMNWSNNSMDAINTYADKSYKDIANNATQKIQETVYDAYAHLRGGQLQIVQQMIDLGQITKEGFNELAQKMDNDFDKVIRYIRTSTNKIIANDNKNADVLHEHLDYGFRELDKAVIKEGAKIKANDNRNAKETQELDAIGKRISANLTHANVLHLPETVNKMNSMLETVVKSQLPHDTKKELAEKIANLAKDCYIKDSDMDKLQGEINYAIRKNIKIER